MKILRIIGDIKESFKITLPDIRRKISQVE